MNRRFDSHLFWGTHSPLFAFTGSGLIIMASGKFAFALVCSGALIWVYGLTALIFSCARKIMPFRGKKVILLFLSTFLCGIFMLILYLLNPLLILGTFFFLLLIPPCCMGSGFFETVEPVDIAESVSRALLEAVILSAIILALAIVREPLGMGTLSLPGGLNGIVDFFDNRETDAFVPARILSVSAGGLLLLGYGTALYRYFRKHIAPRSEVAEEEL